MTASNAVGTSTFSGTSNSIIPATVPGAPTIGTATRGNGEVTVTFTAPASNGGSAITTYTVSSNTGGFTAAGGSSPITVTGLSNGTAYTFTVTASNTYGTSTASSASNSATPAAILARQPSAQRQRAMAKQQSHSVRLRATAVLQSQVTPSLQMSVVSAQAAGHLRSP